MESMNLAKLDGKVLSLWLTDQDGESAVFSGIARWNGSTLVLERTPDSPLEIRPEWHDRIQIVANEEVREILLGADYFLQLSVGDMAAEGTTECFDQTGLKWPK
jgi:hypothetical protein